MYYVHGRGNSLNAVEYLDRIDKTRIYLWELKQTKRRDGGNRCRLKGGVSVRGSGGEK